MRFCKYLLTLLILGSLPAPAGIVAVDGVYIWFEVSCTSNGGYCADSADLQRIIFFGAQGLRLESITIDLGEGLQYDTTDNSNVTSLDSTAPGNWGPWRYDFHSTINPEPVTPLPRPASVLSGSEPGTGTHDPITVIFDDFTSGTLDFGVDIDQSCNTIHVCDIVSFQDFMEGGAVSVTFSLATLNPNHRFVGPNSFTFDVNSRRPSPGWVNQSGVSALFRFSQTIEYTGDAPEPATYILLTAGLAAIGFLSRRRRST